MNAVVGTASLPPRNHELPRSLNSPLENELLAALSAPVRQRLFPRLELCYLPQGSVLARPRMYNTHVYFPIDCLISRHDPIADDDGTALAVVGNDGMIGADLFMDSDSTAIVAMVQIAGYAFRIENQVVVDELSRHGELLAVLSHYSDKLLAQMAQTVVCNRCHTPEHQLCRWLLLAMDRLPTASFKMTQQQLSHTLGALRPSMTQAAWRLQKEGVLNYSNGQVTLLDRRKLEALSCGCHQEHNITTVACAQTALKQA